MSSEYPFKNTPKPEIKNHLFKGNAHVGTLLKIYPTDFSHVKHPYYAKIISTDNNGFVTELSGDNPSKITKSHNRRFSYKDPEWLAYHFKRIEVC